MRLELLKRLNEAAGIPGYEDNLRAIVIPELRATCDEVSTDALGNVIGIKRASGGSGWMVKRTLSGWDSEKLGSNGAAIGMSALSRYASAGYWKLRRNRSRDGV